MSDEDSGFTNPEWMAKAVIANADTRLLKLSVVSLIGWLMDMSPDREVAQFEVVDRLLQVAVSGHYHRPVNAYLNESEDIREFLIDLDDPDVLRDFLGGDEDDDD